jgi:hypothetical protein
VNDFLHTIYITQFKFNCTGGSRYVAGWFIFFFNVKKKYQGDVNIFEKRKEIWVWSLTRMSLISLTNLITWLENHILTTNKAGKKINNDSMQKMNACQYCENISLQYS